MVSEKSDEGFRIWPLMMLICCIPLFHYIFTLLFYLGVSCSLGEWANTEGAHDPKSFLGGIPHGISLILMMASFAMGPLVIWLGFKMRRMGPCLSVYVLALASDLLLFNVATPWLGMWILD